MKYLIQSVSINPKLERDRDTEKIENVKWQREGGAQQIIMVNQIKEQ